jgi:HTH-type transcriptional regulator, sugar sensing transcriptional regulator
MNGLINSRLDSIELDVQKEEILTLLGRMGLSDYEAKTYLALVMRSHGSAEDVAESADIPRTSAYKVLDNLKGKGFVLSRGGRPAVFHPVPPMEIKERMVADLDRIFRQLDSVKGSLSDRGTPQLVYTITGREKVLAKIGEMLDLAKERFFLSSPTLLEINATHASKFANALKRGVSITVVAEHSAKVPEASEVIRKQDLLATDVITDDEIAMIASPDLSICGFTDNPFLAAHLDHFFQMALEKNE